MTEASQARALITHVLLALPMPPEALAVTLAEVLVSLVASEALKPEDMQTLPLRAFQIHLSEQGQTRADEELPCPHRILIRS